MKTLKYIMILSLIALLFSSCGDDGSSSGLSDEEKLALAWTNFTDALYQDAIDLFNQLIDDEAFLAEAYSGLGWSYSRNGQLNNGLTNFNLGLDNSPSPEIEADIYAGSAFTQEALGDYTEALNNSAEVSSNWQFDHDTQLSYDDVVLLRAICYYALADFANSLLQVQILDPDFTCAVETEEGRAALAAKIEELRGEV
jgi:tetratricopeptide (TPR) repeat protein